MQSEHVDKLLIEAGDILYRTEDDQGIPFRSYPYFAWLCPAGGDKHLICFTPGEKPILLYYSPQDFWYEHKTLGETFWTDAFTLEEFADEKKIWERARALVPRGGYLGPHIQKARDAGLQTDLTNLKHRLNWERSYKTSYELHCVKEATQIAARGHRAAKDAFSDGGSELDIYNAYLSGARLTGNELPFDAIIAMNEKCAVLHYENKRDEPRHGFSLLVDAGASFHGYASDISRTYIANKPPREYQQLYHGMERLQQSICSVVTAGMHFGDLHHGFHTSLAGLLLECKIIQDISVDGAVTSGITRAFCPHGLGHMLGIQVHDVGGKQKDAKGTPCDIDPRYPSLRTLRTIEEKFIFTIEPGIYFIEMLLNPLKQEKTGAHINWPLVEKLAPMGGIRIEDDLYVGNNCVMNITRAYLK
jgi:Xaa-Pro dipeptidase